MNYTNFSKDLLKDKIILLAGVSDNLSAYIAKTLVEHGAFVILLGKNIFKLSKLYDEINEKIPHKTAIYPMDFAQAGQEDYQELFEVLQKEFDHLDGLLHHAHYLHGLTPIANFPAHEWFLTLHINLNAAFLLTQTTLPLLKKSSAASILFTTCSSAKGSPYFGAHGVSKAGIECFMNMLNIELEINFPHIRVNAIDPGKLKGKTRAKLYPGEDQDDLPSYESLMPFYLYLMSQHSIQIKGEILRISEIKDLYLFASPLVC